MKTDKLEKFIIDNREAFDDLELQPELWEKVEIRKPKKVSINWRNIGLRVAAVVLIFVSSYYFHDFVQNRSNRQGAPLSTAYSEDQKGMYRRLIEAEFYYTAQIEETKAEVYQLTSNNHRLRSEINDELLDLERAFTELKNDLRDNADNEEVIVAMIRNYRIKLEILNDILNQLQPNEIKKNNDEAKQISF